MEDKSLLAVFAHPDDESFGISGTCAKYSQAGVEVNFICATRGEAGSRVQERPLDRERLGKIREGEVRAAARIMGAKGLFFLDYIDGEVKGADFGQVVKKIRAIVDSLKPRVLITFGPRGITGHDDHVTVGRAATKVFYDLQKESAGYPQKLYFVAIPKGLAPELELTGVEREVTTEVDISGFAEAKIQALSCHQSQHEALEFARGLQADPPKFEYYHRAFPAMPKNRRERDLFEDV